MFAAFSAILPTGEAVLPETMRGMRHVVLEVRRYQRRIGAGKHA